MEAQSVLNGKNEPSTPVSATPIWERQADEKEHHHEWFHAWLMLGPSRSLLAAHNAVQARKRPNKPASTCTPGAWKIVAEKRNWRERAASWDLWQQHETEERLRERQRGLEDRLFRVRERLVDKVEKMLDFPLHKVTSSGSGGTTIIEPTRWNLNSIAHLLNAQQKLGGESDIVKYIDLSALSEDQLLRLSKGENIYRVLGLHEPKSESNQSGGVGGIEPLELGEERAANSHDDIADSR